MTTSKVYAHGDNGYIDGPISESRMISLKLQGFKKWKDSKLFFELSAANVATVLQSIPESNWNGEAKSRAIEVIKHQEESARLAKEKVSSMPLEASLGFPFKTKPYDHQLKAFNLSKDLDFFGYFMEMGTGKTKVEIDVAAYQYSIGKIDTLIILAPNGVHKQWVTEQIPTHMPEHIPYECFVYRSGMNKIQKAKFCSLMERDDCLKIIAINAEALSHKSGQEFYETLLHSSQAMVGVDESSRFKNPSALRTKFLLKTATYAKSRRILSGSPVTKGIEDLYPQLKFLSPDILGFSSFYTFRNRYCVMGGYEGKVIIGYRNVEELRKKIDPYTFRVRKEECIDLPGITYLEDLIELTAEQKKAIKSIKTELHFEFSNNGGRLNTPLAITRLIRIQQVASGFLPDDEGNIHYLVPLEKNPRVNRTIELVNDMDGKVIVWARFKEEIKMLKKAFEKAGISYITYDDSEGEDRNDKLLRYQTEPEIKAMISNQVTGGIGLNITQSTYTIYFSNTYDLETRLQSEARNYRSGQTKPVTCIDLCAIGSNDKAIAGALKQKKSIADMVVDGIEILFDEDDQ